MWVVAVLQKDRFAGLPSLSREASGDAKTIKASPIFGDESDEEEDGSMGVPTPPRKPAQRVCATA